MIRLAAHPPTPAETKPAARWPRDERIIVAPVEPGWSVQSAIAGLPLMFLSGARAEEKAKALAASIAACGRDAQVLIHDRRDALVGTMLYFADDSLDA